MTREELLNIAKPILFNTDMVRAIMDGRKTVTRRALKHPFEIHPNGYITKPRGNERLCPYEPPYQPGDILYVRETWQYLYKLDGNDQIIENTGKYYYAATDTTGEYVDSRGIMHETTPWHPSIHMPKEAARIFLKVTDVRVERLQDITDVDAEKEGAQPDNPCDYSPEQWQNKEHFKKIWNSTIKKSELGKYGWDANPYVWVIEFKKLEAEQ